MKYKVGDKVRIKSIDWYNKNKDEDGEFSCGEFDFVEGMKKFCSEVFTISEDVGDGYLMLEDNHGYVWSDEMIEGLMEEEEIEFTEEDKYWCDIMSESDPTTYVLPQGYQFVDENGNVINARKIVLEKKKKEYPKTYEECCHVVQTAFVCDVRLHKGKYYDIFRALAKLIVCRDAYWKIAGQEMRLDKPWEPDWSDEHQKKFTIYTMDNAVIRHFGCYIHCILAFPTEEMRDAFYKNFKELIESCKELL